MNVGHILALGGRTVLGHTPQTAAAAVRAGISRVESHPFLVDSGGAPIRGAFDETIDEQASAVERMHALASHALLGLEERLERPLPPLSLLLALPEHRPGFDEKDQLALESSLQRHQGRLTFNSVRTVAQGHAGGLEALRLAADVTPRLPEGLCVVGGIASYLDPRTIAWLSSNRQLIRPDSRTGFFPGEAAFFALFASQQTRRSLGSESLATVHGAGSAMEPRRIRSDLDNLGRGLTDAIRQACSGVDGLIDQVYSDINGERYRAEEWGLAILNTSQWFRNPAGYIAPAGQWGDLGAATGLALTSLAAESWRRGYSAGPLAMLIAGSEAGLRGAVVLGAPEAKA